MAVNYDVPILFSEKYISGLNDLQNIGEDKIKSVYGSTRHSIIGQARYNEKIPLIDYAELEKNISQLHDLKIKFHYTINSPWSNFKERKTEYRIQIIDDLQTLVDIGVDAFVVANPYLISLIKSNFPNIDIIASINFQTVTAFKFLNLIELGCKSVVLDRPINRNISFLKKIKKDAEKFSLLVNSTCLFDCPMQQYHANENGYFSSESIDSFEDREFCIDYCLNLIEKHPENILKSTWIRPEDISKYENIGVKNFKIQGRTLEPEILLSIIKSYLFRETPNDSLFFIFPDFTTKIPIVSRIMNNSQIDKLNFVDFFFNNEINCLDNCLTCKHCKETFDALEIASTLPKPHDQRSNQSFVKELAKPTH